MLFRHSILGALSACFMALGCAAEAGDESDEAQDAVTTLPMCKDATAQDAKCKLKVVSINLRHDVDQWKERRRALVVQELDRLTPDVIGMQEVEIGEDQAKWIQDHLKVKYNRVQNRKTGLIGYLGGEGIGTLSRFKITEDGAVDLEENRVVQRARIELPQGMKLDVFNTHLHAGGGADGDKIRAMQADKVVKYMDKHAASVGNRLLTGDMNANDDALAIRHYLAGGLTDSFRSLHARHQNLGATSPIPLKEGAVPAPKNRIDFIFSKGSKLRPIASEVVLKVHDASGFYASDHFAVMTTYEVTLK